MSRRSRKDLVGGLNALKLARKIRQILRVIWDVMEPVLADAANRIIVEEGLPLARKLVHDLENQALSGEEKRRRAVEGVRNALEESGKIAKENIAESMINWVIETAVNEVKLNIEEKEDGQ